MKTRERTTVFWAWAHLLDNGHGRQFKFDTIFNIDDEINLVFFRPGAQQAAQKGLRQFAV
jgi:hypothetical protein